MRRRFDVAVVVPLDEEFETALSYFQFVADLSTNQRIRFEVAVPDADLTVLLTKQNVMGRTECANATLDIVDEFEVGMLVCLGIAGGLPNLTPRAFAAAKAFLVRSPMRPASSSATAAICVSRRSAP